MSEKVAHLVFDVESIADGDLISKVRLSRSEPQQQRSNRYLSGRTDGTARNNLHSTYVPDTNRSRDRKSRARFANCSI